MVVLIVYHSVITSQRDTLRVQARCGVFDWIFRHPAQIGHAPRDRARRRRGAAGGRAIDHVEQFTYAFPRFEQVSTITGHVGVR